MEYSFNLTLPDGLAADAVLAYRFDALPDFLNRLGLGKSPVLVVAGGAGGMTDDDYGRLKPLFVDVLAPLAQSLGATVIDGGTDAGVMRWMGEARAEIGGTFPLVGVAAVGTVILPGRENAKPDAALPACGHSHFLFVPGEIWGDESPWLARTATLVSAGFGSVTIVFNGGETTWWDVFYSVREGRPTLVVVGSGRTADQLAGALSGEESDPRAAPLVASGLLEAIGLDWRRAVIADRIRRWLTESSH
jgi:SLOG in TRPM, prokaryote